MDLMTLLKLVKGWDALGWAVQEQAAQAIEGDADDLNSNAVDMICRWLDDVERNADGDLSEEAGDLATELRAQYA